MPINYVRVTVGDNIVCNSCVRYEQLPPRPIEWWEQSGLLPRVAPSECNGKCRCGMSPEAMSDIQAEAERLVNMAVEEGFDRGIQIDLTEGRRIFLKDFKHIEDLLSVQYERIAYMESLIYKWKIATDGKKLPVEFFNNTKIDDMVKWLEDDLELKK